LNAPFRSAGLAGLILGVGLLLLTPNVDAEERVNFKNAQGETIEAIYIPPPSGRTAPAPAVIMLHGCAGLFTKSGKIRSRERAWIDILHNEGWALLLPDSFGSRGHGSLCQTKNRPVKPERERPYDAVAALEYLAKAPGIDAAKIALLGWSNGAMTGLHTIRDGAAASRSDGTKDFRTAVVFYPGCIALKKSFPNYRPRVPLLIQHGEKDDWTLAKPCVELIRKVAAAGDAPPAFIDVYPDSYHGFDHPTSKLKTIITKHSGYASGQRKVHVGKNPEAREKAIARTLDWLRAHLN